MSIQFKDIRNVRLFNEDIEAYLCELDLKVSEDDPWETVEYCAREGGGGICDQVIHEISKGNFIGQLLDGSPGNKEFFEDLRAARDEKLQASDIYVLPDRWAAMTEEKRSAWAIYRQALRDLPDSTEDPTLVDWPVEPA